MKSARGAAIPFILLTLSACGGGGGSTPTSASPPQASPPEPAAEAPTSEPAPEPAAQAPEPPPQYPAFTEANQIWNALPGDALTAMRNGGGCRGWGCSEGFSTERAAEIAVHRDPRWVRVPAPEDPGSDTKLEYLPDPDLPDGALRFESSRGGSGSGEWSFDSKGGTTVEVTDDTAMTATVQIIGDVDSSEWVALGHWMTLRGEDFIASAPGAARPVFARDIPVRAGVFIEGPWHNTRDPANAFLPVRGSASYEGPALGLHATESGVSGFTARATLNALYEFGGDRLRVPLLQGRVSNISTAPGLSIELTGTPGGSTEGPVGTCGAPQPVCDSGAAIQGHTPNFYVDSGVTRLLKGENRTDRAGAWGATLDGDLYSGHPAAVGGAFHADGVVDDVRHVFMGAYYADIEPDSVR